MEVKKLRLCLLLALVLFICGCATIHKTVPSFIAGSPPEDGAIVYFYRPSKSAASAVTPKVLHNKDLYNFELANGKYIEHVVNPGKHEFKIVSLNPKKQTASGFKLNMYMSEPVAFEFKSGETHFIKMVVNQKVS